MAQDKVLSAFLSHLENALAASLSKKSNSVPLTLVMEADDEDDMDFFENLLKLKDNRLNRSDSSRCKRRRGFNDITNSNSCGTKVYNDTFMDQINVRAIQSRESLGRVGSIAIKLPVMKNDGNIFCISTVTDCSQRLEEAVVAARVIDNVEVDDLLLFDGLYGGSVVDTHESGMTEIGQQQEEQISSSGPLQSVGFAHDDITASSSAHLGATLTSIKASLRVSVCNVGKGIEGGDDDLGLFSGSYGESTSTSFMDKIKRRQQDSSYILSSYVGNEVKEQRNFTSGSVERVRRKNTLGLYIQSIFSRVRDVEGATKSKSRSQLFGGLRRKRNSFQLRRN